VLRRICAPAFLSLSAILLLAAPAAAAPAVSGEFAVPGLGSNNKLVQGPDGNMWVTLGGGAGNDVAKITPDGVVTEYKIEAVTPRGIAAGPAGRLWVARDNGLVSFDPANPTGTKQVFNVPQIGTSPSIVLGPDGNLWTAGENKLAKIPPANPVAGAVEVPVPGLQTPKDVDVAGSLIVVAAFQHVFAVTTAGAVVGDQKVGGQSQGVSGNPNGQYAFTQPVTPPKEIGLLSPTAAPIVRSAEGTDPFGIALGADGAYWSPEFISDGLTRIAADGTVSSLAGFAKNSAPRQIAAGPGNTLWVTLEMTKKVGRVSGLEPPAVVPATPALAPTTTIKGGPKGKLTTPGKRRKVSFRFASPEAGAGFECRLRRLPRKPIAKASKGAFAPCASPRTYRLRPGRYRFEVRAVLAGIADPTPAGRSFRIVHKPRK
jgi:streptogramin lyase